MSEEENEELKRRVRNKITVKIDTNELVEKLAKLQEENRETDQYSMEAKALSIFDGIKDQFYEATNDEGVLGIDNPKELETYIRDHLKQYHNPSGKSTNPNYNKGNSERFDNPRALMDSIYNRAYNRGIPNKTEDGLKARQQIEEIFEAWLGGKSWSQMKNKLRDRKHPFPKSDVELLTCPKCHMTIESFPCQYCSYNPKTRKVF